MSVPPRPPPATHRITQLFDMENDPWETADLAADPAYSGLLRALREDMLAGVAHTRPAAS